MSGVPEESNDVFGEEVLEEVIFDEDLPPDDDDTSSIWTDATAQDVTEEEIETAGGASSAIDMSSCVFKGHSDSVYCAAIHPNGHLIVTGIITSISFFLLFPLLFIMRMSMNVYFTILILKLKFNTFS